MDATVWGGLPSEVEERVLSYLSTPVLCRFRTVCKRWNSLIKNPEFSALCIRNAPQVASFLVAWSYTDKANPENGPARDNWPWFIRGQTHGWILLDVKARRWYTIPKPINQELLHRFDLDKCKCCVVLDGGLVCQVMATQKNASSETHRLETWYAVADMVVGAGTGCYTVFVLPQLACKEENPVMVIYESRTDAWRSSSLPVVSEAPVNVDYVFHSTKCFSSLLYVLARADRGDSLLRGDARPDQSWMWGYNHGEDSLRISI